MVRVEDAPARTVVGFSEALAPGGRPETERSTGCAEPVSTAVSTVTETVACCRLLACVGTALIEKSLLPWLAKTSSCAADPLKTSTSTWPLIPGTEAVSLHCQMIQLLHGGSSCGHEESDPV